jgi:Family of unknown function (DUF5318)
MTLTLASLRGGSGGVVDHRLARQHLINEYRRARLRQDEICDAHPELIRAAKNLGTPASTPCPICAADGLRLVTYVFGSRLPRHGRCVTDAASLAELAGSRDDLTAYVVEACTECRWHHLLRVVPVTAGARARRRAAADR